MGKQATITYWERAEGTYKAPRLLLADVDAADTLADVDEVVFTERVQQYGWICLGESKEPFPSCVSGACEIVCVATMPCLRTLKERYVAFIN